MRGLLYSNMPRSVSLGRMRWSLTGTMVCLEPQGRPLFHGEECRWCLGTDETRRVCVCVSFFFFFFFCFLLVENRISAGKWPVSGSHALFTDPQTSLFNNFFTKNGSHGTIHTLKNYFVTVFSVFSGIQADP